jgi:hypothetical protein
MRPASQLTPGTERAPRRATAALVAIAAIGAFGAGASDDVIDSTRAAIERWVETQRLISREERDWALGREILDDRIEIVQREVASVDGKIREADGSITELDRKRDELVAESDRLRAAAADLEGTVAAIEARTKSLLARVPEPLRERVRPLSQQLPGDSVPEGLTVENRYQNVVGILNEIHKFQRDITMKSEVRSLPDGSSSEVTAVYLGISQGYYVSNNGLIAGIGAPSDDGWTWTPANERAKEIGEVIAILKNERVAEFVAIPVQIK